MSNLSRYLIIFTLVVIITGSVIFHFQSQQKSVTIADTPQAKTQQSQIESNPLSIQAMRKKSYPGSELVIEETLSPAGNYNQYIASYKSDGLKIDGLLTVPKGDKPSSGWPVIIFNHGYIPPEQYRTTERYVAYVDAFARNGYIVFKPDYRGNGSSEGQPEGAYYSPAYAADVLNALSSLKRFPDADPNRIGMWGHSMGGNITLRDIVVDTKDIKAAVIWGA
jgi:cephalosporin-C deacetylase-like acetyl esterase